MKARSKIILLLVFVLSFAVACSNDDVAKETTTSTEQTTTESVSATTEAAEPSLEAFDMPLMQLIDTEKNKVYHFAKDDIQVKMLCAKVEAMMHGKLYYFEGEYRDDDARLHYINDIYFLTDDQLIQCYDDVMFSLSINHSTLWLKSSFKLGDSWQTEYLDEKEGYLDALVTVTNIQEDQVTVELKIDDSSIAEYSAYTIVKKFPMNGSVLGDGLWLADVGEISYVGDTFYEETSENEYLNRFTSEVEWVKGIFDNEPVVIKSLLAEYKKDIRGCKTDQQVALRFRKFVKNMLPVQPYEPELYVEAFNYALAHGNEHLQLVEVFNDAMDGTMVEDEYMARMESRAMDKLNASLYLVVDTGLIDPQQIVNDKISPIPHAGDFRGAKYFEEAYRRNDYFVDTNDFLISEAMIYESPYGHYKSRSGVYNALINKVKTDDQNVINYLKLKVLYDSSFGDLFEKLSESSPGGVYEYGEEAYIPFFIDLLTQSDDFYAALSDDYRQSVEPIMKGILFEIMSKDDAYLSKYNQAVGLTSDSEIETVAADMAGYNVTLQFNKNLYDALSNYLKNRPDSYYGEQLKALLNALKDNYMLYNKAFEKLLIKISSEEQIYLYYTRLIGVLMRDLEDYKDFKVANQPADSASYTTVYNLKELVDAIAPSARINLAPGSYVINSSETYSSNYASIADGVLSIHDVTDLNIRCDEGLAQILSTVYDSVIRISDCDYVKLDGLRVGHLVDSGCMGFAVELMYSDNIQLNNCILYGSGYNSLHADTCNNIAIDNCVISDTEAEGIVLYDCENVRLNHLMIRDCGDCAIYADNSQKVLIKDVTSAGNHRYNDGIALAMIRIESSDVTITDFRMTEINMSLYDKSEDSTVREE